MLDKAIKAVIVESNRTGIVGAGSATWEIQGGEDAKKHFPK